MCENFEPLLDSCALQVNENTDQFAGEQIDRRLPGGFCGNTTSSPAKTVFDFTVGW